MTQIQMHKGTCCVGVVRVFYEFKHGEPWAANQLIAEQLEDTCSRSERLKNIFGIVFSHCGYPCDLWAFKFLVPESCFKSIRM